MPRDGSGYQLHKTNLVEVGLEQLGAVKGAEFFDLLAGTMVIDLHVKGIDGIKSNDVVVFPALAKQYAFITENMSLDREGKQLEFGKAHANRDW
jgi:hypothetical protein